LVNWGRHPDVEIWRCCTAALLLALCGCASYTTPGSGVSIPYLSKADADIGELMKAEAAAVFPARMAVARVQASGYASQTSQCFGAGRYCVVTNRDIESEEHFNQLARLPQLAGLAPMSRLLLPTDLRSLKDLRVAAAALKTDLLLIYTFETGFRVADAAVAPMTLISLGLLPTRTATVTTTASAVIFDVRTGFIYGAAESTTTQEQRSSVWSTRQAIDAARVATEKSAFQKLVDEISRMWPGVVAAHAVPARSGG
jgi:hypothetical protein